MKSSPAEWSKTQHMSLSGSDKTGQSLMQKGTGIGSNFSANQLVCIISLFGNRPRRSATNSRDSDRSRGE
jgi:hypothetical protein